MTELWLIVGEGYALPVLGVNDGLGVYEVRPADVNFLDIQMELLEEVLHKTAFRIGQGDIFYCTEAALKTVARLVAEYSEGLDPENFLHWTRKTRKSGEASEAYTGDNEDEFYTRFATSCAGPGLTSPEQSKVLFFWFCAHMLDWLLNKQKPVDLYFCKLHPLPYRADWKNQILEKDMLLPNLPIGKRGTKLTRFIPDMFKRLGEFFYGPDILSLNEDGETVGWTLEVELREPYLEHARRLEKLRLEVRGPEGYWAGVMQNLKRAGLTAMRLYALWLGQIKSPRPAIPVIWDDHRCEFAPIWKNQTPQRPARPSALSVVLDPGKVGPVQPDRVGTADASLLPVSYFQ